MKRAVLLTACLLIALFADAKKFKTLNEGGTKQKNYFSVIPYEEMLGSLPIITVEIGGKERRFLLDTGAATCIRQELADELSIGRADTMRVYDAEGNAEMLSICTLPEITIDGIAFNNIPAIILKETPFTRCLEIDGIVGSNLLRKSVVRFSHANKTITITDQPKKLNLHQKKELAAKMFLANNQSLPIVEVKIKDSINASGGVLFDTGMNGLYDIALDHFHALDKLHAFTDSIWVAEGSNAHGLHGQMKHTIRYNFHVPFVEINGFDFKNVKISTSTDKGSKIGSAFLKYGDFTLDFRNKRFYFEPYSEETPDLFEKRIGFSPNIEDGKLIVGLIWDSTLESVISVGDQILSADGIRFDAMSECELMQYKLDSFLKDKDSVVFEIKNKNKPNSLLTLSISRNNDNAAETEKKQAEQ